jgi:hypothetical protein
MTSYVAKIKVIAGAFVESLNRSFAEIMRSQAFQKTVLRDHQDYRFGESDDELLDQALGERYNDWMTMLERQGVFLGDKLEIYRGVSVKNPEDIDFQNLGVFWTWKKDKAQNYSDKNTKLPLVIITARVGVEQINIKETLRKIVWAGYSLDESECEITLKNRARIEVLAPVKRLSRA